MRLIPLNDTREIKASEIIHLIASTVPQGAPGMDIGEMRQRMRILEALEKNKGAEVLELEDADWELLKRLYAVPGRFRQVHKDVAAIQDDIVNAKQK